MGDFIMYEYDFQINHYAKDDNVPTRQIRFSVSPDTVQSFLDAKNLRYPLPQFVEIYTNKEAESLFLYAADHGLLLNSSASYCEECQEKYLKDMELKKIPVNFLLERYYWDVYIKGIWREKDLRR